MSKSTGGKQKEILLKDRFSDDSSSQPEIAFRRWLVGELDSGRMTEGEARARFHIGEATWWKLLRRWRRLYSSDIPLTLPPMTEKEQRELEALHKRIKELEKHLEDAKVNNTALETLVDVAEQKLRISIRKKSGPKQ
ncbi:hypothetical protein H8B06_20460 [Sphingobacterium sp. DN00404]|uniref:Transposase n=1 Tax=Sphingobacterium micropteri TaxID=2763501 RepID=A0ABR7YV37_9SPHI|nr:hypothetical protein [Sphingobacterium micropteri]MBD1435203.1 hypothetical protein [Sphingobacterium micropteri]